MDSADLDALRRAKAILETPGLAIRIADKAGMPIEALVRRLPPGAQEAVASAVTLSSVRTRAIGSFRSRSALAITSGLSWPVSFR